VRQTTVRWRDDVRHLLVSLAVAVAGYTLLVLIAVAVVASALGGLGLPLLRWALGRVRTLADLQRARSGLTPGALDPVSLTTLSGVLAEVAAALSPPRTRRELLWLASPVQAFLAALEVQLGMTAAAGVLMPVIWVVAPGALRDYLGITVVDLSSSFLAVPNGLVFAALTAWAAGPLIGIESWQARRLLGTSEVERLAERVDDLARSRSSALDASAVELRRIERDLHDGTQARLVSLAMNLGMAQDLLATDPDRAAALLTAARSQASTATTELRALVYGIYPPVLADRGLDGALRALALDSPVPIELDLRLDRRLSPPVESAAYFALVEAVSNAVKHSGASSIRLTLDDHGDRVVLRVKDDGCGGADRTQGTGLRGIEGRVAVFDGSLDVDSPAGGPTLVRVELPCVS